ncbi:MAG: polyamine ABC transporter substrate-binding protein, partial [Solirubrobacteraceae bacterium]
MAEQLTRRRFLEAGVALTTLPAIFAACGIEGTGPTEEEAAQAAQEVRHPKEQIGNWTFSNWPLYMDKKVLKSFDKQYGGKVRYLEEINDNYEFYGKVGQQLEQKKPIGRDIVVLTDYMASRWVRNAYVEAIDKANVPNAAN